MKVQLAKALCFSIVAIMVVSACTSTIHDAAREGERDDIRRAIRDGSDVNAPDQQGRTALHLVAAYGHENTANELIRNQGANVNALDSNNQTPLHAAASGGHKQIVAALLAAGADPTVKDKFGHTPLDLARMGAHPQCIAALEAAMELRTARPSP